MAGAEVMPKKPTKLRPDVAETAFRVMQEATGEAPKTLPPGARPKGDRNAEAVKRGAKGGKKGGKRRAAKLSDEERAKAATIAALARWKRSS